MANQGHWSERGALWGGLPSGHRLLVASESGSEAFLPSRVSPRPAHLSSVLVGGRTSQAGQAQEAGVWLLLWDTPGGISLRVQESPAEGQDRWARQEGSGTLAPAFRHTNKPTAWRSAQSCPCCQGSSHHTRKRTEPGLRAACCLELLASATSLPPSPTPLASGLAQTLGLGWAEQCESQVCMRGSMARREAKRHQSQKVPSPLLGRSPDLTNRYKDTQRTSLRPEGTAEAY